MKRFISFVATGMLAGSLAAPASVFAQSNAGGGPVIVSSVGAPTSDLPMEQYNAWDDFSQAHPDVARMLSRNPKLINSESFQRNHPELRDLLSQHPDFAENFSENPGNYVPPIRARAHHM
ncbi:MAG TPA: hypothetical protein VJ718_07910, partial [Candidatus Binataceae bacterium]|nr:hypothetical protein [Candidatus Binataceae bacterium]